MELACVGMEVYLYVQTSLRMSDRAAGEKRRDSLGVQELGTSSTCAAWRTGKNLNLNLAFQAFTMIYLSKQNIFYITVSLIYIV